MKNLYRKFFKVLRAWWLTLILFAFIPMTYAQTIPDITDITVAPVTPGKQGPGDSVTVTLNVVNFLAAGNYNYYVVYNYSDYDMILEFDHDPSPDGVNIDTTGLVNGAGSIVITAVVPVELYRYGDGELTVLVVNANGDLAYQIEEPETWVSSYPVCVGGFYDMGDLNFDSCHYVDRSISTPMFYKFDANTDFSFELRRINKDPAIKNEILVEFRVGANAWEPLDTIDLNDVGYLAGTTFSYDNSYPYWNTAIENVDITVRVSQTDGDALPQGIDTWEITNFVLNDVLNEPNPSSIYTLVFNHFYVENLVTLWEPVANNFTIEQPTFSITAFNSTSEDLYPGTQVTYQITSGANVSFPEATIFEVFLTNTALGEEILLGTFPLTGATGLPAADSAKYFTFNIPFRPDPNWKLNVRADLRDTYVSKSFGPFEILGVNLNATLNLDATPAAEKFKLDGTTYLFPGSELHVSYALGAGQEIKSNVTVDVVLEYDQDPSAAEDWVELKRQAFSNNPGQEIVADLPSSNMISLDAINIRLRLAYSGIGDIKTDYIERIENYTLGWNQDQLEWELDATGNSLASGSKIGFHAFAVNNKPQTLVVEYLYDGQPTWKQLGTLNTLATDNKYVMHYADADYNYSVVPEGVLSIDNPKFRLRWSDGSPLGTNKVLRKGFRVQSPYDEDLGIYAFLGTVNILYPHLTLSTNISQLYEYADTLSSISVTAEYQWWGIPTGTEIAIVMVKNGEYPTTHPYLQLSSKATTAVEGLDAQTFKISYKTIQEFIGGHLPNLPAAGDYFDIYLFAASNDTIMFKTEEIVVGWKENYDAQPMMITDFIDLTGLNPPIYLSYDWVEDVTPDPLNSLTTPIMEFSTDSGTTWAEFDTYPFTTLKELTGDTISNKTQFRWRQIVDLGTWDVQNVKILSGEDNLVTFTYDTTNMPQTIELVLAEVPPVVDPCEDFNNASVDAYEFVTEVENVNAGDTLNFQWNYLLGTAKSKAIIDSSLVALGQFVHGENSTDFNLTFGSDKKITQFTMTFPTNVVPTEADTIIVDGNSLKPAVAAQVITWTSDAGVVIGAQDIVFNVSYTVATSIVDSIKVAWTLTNTDGTVSGTCTILPAGQFPEGTVFTFYIKDGGYTQIAQGTETGPYTAVIPEGTPTGAYDIYLSPSYQYYDEGLEDYVTCVVTGSTTEYPVDGPAKYDYNSNTYTELGWTNISVAEFGNITGVNIQFSWETDSWTNEGRLYLQSPSGTIATLIGNGAGNGTYSLNPTVFVGEEMNGNWLLWIEDTYGDGGHYIYDITITFDYELPTFFKVFDDLFIINDQTPEVYEIELTDVNYINPADDYYWAQDVDVKFNTFGPWQNFEDIRYEAVLTQYGILNPDTTFTEDFEGGIPADWSNTGSGALWGWTGGIAIHWNYYGTQDDWLITPLISLPEGNNLLEFRDYGYSPTLYAQNSILVSTGSSNPLDGDFVTIWAPTSIVSGWVHQQVDLSAYSGQDVYIAFRYQGNNSHVWGIDNVAIISGVYGNTDFYNLGNVPHVEGENMFAETFALPAFDDLEGKNFNLNIDSTDFVVEIRAYQGEEGVSFIPNIVVENIDEFFLLSGTDETVIPLTFDVEDVLRYAVTNKLPLDGYAGQDVYLQFTYNADITAPNSLTLPRLQVTLDNGVTYTDIAIPGSTFESQKRLDATAMNMVYRYQIPEEYLTSDTRFRWYQEVPDGVWGIDAISITRLTNEIPLADYLINDPYHVIVKEPADSASTCDAFDAASLAAYDWAVDSIDTNTGFEAPVIAGQEFEYTFSWNEQNGIDWGLNQYPDSTKFLFYAKKKDSSFKKSQDAVKSFSDRLMIPSIEKIESNLEKSSGTNIELVNAKEDPTDEDGLWIQWHNGVGGDAFGLTEGGVMGTGARWLPEHLGDYDGLSITHVKVAERDIVNGGTLKILQGPDIDSLVEMYSQDFMMAEDSWILIELEEPYVIDASQQLVISVEWNHNNGTYPAYSDSTAWHAGLGDLVHFGDGIWKSLGDDFGYQVDWLISAFVFGAEGPILLNKDGLPVSVSDNQPFVGFVPIDAVTGVYEVEARATIFGEDGEKWSCGPYVGIVKNNLLIINDDNIPDDVRSIELHGVYTPDTLLFIDTLAVGQQFNAMYSTYGGEWPTGINFAAVLYDNSRNDVLGVIDSIGEEVVMDSLHMPYLPFTDPATFGDYDLELQIVAYEGDELVYGDVDIEFEMEENLGFVTKDIIPVADGAVYGYDFDNYKFNAEGERWVTTPVMDLSMVDNTKAKIWFNYYNYSVSPSTQTIPIFQVSEDGGKTWIDLQLLLSDVNKLYSISIEDYFGATTQFRWIQQSNLGYDKDVWNIENVEITTGTTNIFAMSNAIDIVQVIPEVDVDYAFALELEALGLEPTIYAGDEFNFTYDVVEGGYMFPEGTVFTIYLYKDGDVVIDDFTGEEVILYQGTEVGLITATAPIVQRGLYDVYVTAIYLDGEEEYIYDEDYVGVINIYNPVIKTNLVGLDVPYAGGTADFAGVLEIEVEESLNPDFYYNLIIEDGGDEWLIAAQKDSATFNDVFLPPFLYGNLNFKIQASTNGPLGVVGEKIVLSNVQWFPGDTLADETDPGQREYYALDMNDYGISLTDFIFLSFDIYFSEAVENLTENQHMILEYSIDGGKSYTEIHTYPDERFTDELYFNGDYFMEEDLPIPAEAKVEGAIIRWRIQESKGNVILNNIKLSSDNTIQNAPYYALVSEIPVAQQRIEVLGTNSLSYCSNEDITLTYNIRGSFGEFAELWLTANGAWAEDMYYVGITEGTGEITVSAQLLSDLDVSGDVQFQFHVVDRTYNVAEYGNFVNELWGDPTDFIYIVPQIDEGTDVDSDNNYACEIAERSVIIIDPQDYFVYQIRNAVTLNWLSEPVLFDPDDMSLFNMYGEFEIPIGVVSETTIAEVVVTAQSKDSTKICETMVLDEQIVFDVHEFALQYRWYNNSIGGVWTDVPADAADFIYCYESGNLEFRVWDYKANMGEGAVIEEDIKWYRDNTETPVGTDVAEFSNFPLTGEYFAVITSEGCDPWTSQHVNVVVERPPEKPVIEFVGEQEFCEGGHASLQIPDDYAHYRWYIDGVEIEGSDTCVIDIYQSGFYKVEVSNYAFDPFIPVCTNISDELNVDLIIHEKPYIPDFELVDDDLCEPMPAQIRIRNYEGDVWYQPYVWETGEATGTAKFGYEGGDPIILETDVLEQGVKLGVMAWKRGIEMCEPVYSPDVYEVKVYNLTMEVSSNVLFASLAPYDNQVSTYQWFRNGVLVKNNGDGQYLTVYDEAVYSVVVVTYDGCILETSTERLQPDAGVVPKTMAVNIYPNPVPNNLTLKLNGDYIGELQVKIINLAGVVLFDTNIEKNAVEFEQVISIETLTQGVYIMQITGGEYSDVKHFIKK